MAGEDEEDYARPPESSSEDEEKTTPTLQNSPPAKRKREPSKPTRSSKRKKLEDSPGLPAPASQPKERSHPSQHGEVDMFSLFSQSQKRRLGYGNRKKPKDEVEALEPKLLGRKGPAFDAHDFNERQANVPEKTRNFNMEEECSPEKQIHPTRPASRLTILQDEQDHPASSASSVNTSIRLFEETPEPEEASTKPIALSSPPTSPDVINVDEAAPDASQPKAELSAVLCPVCHQEVARSYILPLERHPRFLSLKRQQEFCRRHRMNDAQNLLKQHDYPTIDWEVLELERIPKHVDHLEGVLRGKVKSYYADQLSMAITKAKGNRRAVREYLTEGVLDIVKPGYYGPKGSTMMMGQIISKMSKDLSNKLEDRLVRTAGMGNYVAAVLVPELTLRLVMEDLNLTDEAEGRKALDESTGVGLLLNADEDHVD